MNPKYSVVIPVYNRPDEVDELLQSLCSQTYRNFEVVVVEDGSAIPCKQVVDKYAEALDVHYLRNRIRTRTDTQLCGRAQLRRVSADSGF